MAALVVAVSGACGEIAVIAVAVDVATVEALLFRHRAETADDPDLYARLGSGLLHHVVGIGGAFFDRLPVHSDDGDRKGPPLDVARVKAFAAVDQGLGFGFVARCEVGFVVVVVVVGFKAAGRQKPPAP